MELNETEREIVAGKRPKGARGEAWGILNPYGDLWTHSTFDSPEEATAYVERFWQGISGARDLRRFRPIRVKVHVTAKARKQVDGRYAIESGSHRKEG